MNILILGGTRNMGHLLTWALLDAGHTVTVLNRGKTAHELPEHVEQLHADRTVAAQLERALRGRTFDVVVDFILFNGEEAETIVDLLHGKTGHYIFISTGQVYLLRDGATKPYKESDYSGALMAEPALNTYDHEEWAYGYHKRRAEDVLARAASERNFSYTALRLPMVNGTRDPFNRLYGYMLRIKDGGPILVPETPNAPLRHIYAPDVVRAVMTVIDKGQTEHPAYNISQDETVTLSDFLHIMGDAMGEAPNIVTLERDILVANGFLPDCSPFSDTWMSELDNTLSKSALNMTYTPLKDYLAHLVSHYTENPPKQPASYQRRPAEKQFALMRG